MMNERETKKVSFEVELMLLLDKYLGKKVNID